MQGLGWASGFLTTLRRLSFAVAYSPTPIGVELTAENDWFTDEHAGIYERDLPRMAAIGINAIRIYSFHRGHTHTRFLDTCRRYNISVMGSFELLASHYNLATPHGVALAEANLRAQLHEFLGSENDAQTSAAVVWFVGNEINLEPVGFICDENYSTQCQFTGAGLPQLFRVIDDLCGIVHEYGLLCSSPLANVGVPSSYHGQLGTTSREGATRWFYELDVLGMDNIDLWSANLYIPGGTRLGSNLPSDRPWASPLWDDPCCPALLTPLPS